MPDDPRVRAYFDRRAEAFDRLYDRRTGLGGRLEAWVYSPLRRNFELTLAELGDLTGKRVLDVGCGSGRYAVAAATRGAEVVGVDLSPAMLALARERARDEGVADRCRFVEAGFDAFEPEARFDVGLMISFLEYRANPCLELARLSEHTREKMIVSVPLPRRWRMMARRVRHWARGSPPSLHPHDPAAVVACLEKVGFRSWRSDRGWFVAYRGRRGGITK